MISNCLGLVKINDSEYLRLCESIKRHYRIDCEYELSYHTPYHRFFTNYTWRRRWSYNNRWRLQSIHKKTNRIDTIGHLCRVRVYDRLNRKQTWRNAFIKECPMIPIEFTHHYHDIQNKSIDVAHPLVEETVRYLHSPESQTHMETFITYALSRLTETGQAPTFPLFYGAWRTTMREWTKDMSDAPELEEIEQYMEETKFAKYNEDDTSFDLHNNRQAIIKTNYDIYEYGDGSIWCSVNHFPVQLLATEKLNTDLYNLARKQSISSAELMSIWWQVVYGIWTYQKLGITHNDLHVSNVMYKATISPWLYYKWGNDIIRIPTFGKIWKIIDFGRATYDEGRLNTVYESSGECCRMLYPLRPNRLGQPAKRPHKGVDTMTLAMNIIMDVLNTPLSKKDSELFRYFDNMISNSSGNRICFIEEEITFNDHVRIMNTEPESKTFPAYILEELKGRYEIIALGEIEDGVEIWG